MLVPITILQCALTAASGPEEIHSNPTVSQAHIILFLQVHATVSLGYNPFVMFLKIIYYVAKLSGT